jgi:hypothetical protein
MDIWEDQISGMFWYTVPGSEVRGPFKTRREALHSAEWTLLLTGKTNEKV